MEAMRFVEGLGAGVERHRASLGCWRLAAVGYGCGGLLAKDLMATQTTLTQVAIRSLDRAQTANSFAGSNVGSCGTAICFGQSDVSRTRHTSTTDGSCGDDD